jgi:hypothetical protein
MSSIPLRDDLLTGASAIADYTGWPVRKVYHAASRGYLPVMRIGPILLARKSELDRAFSAEAANLPRRRLKSDTPTTA